MTIPTIDITNTDLDFDDDFIRDFCEIETRIYADRKPIQSNEIIGDADAALRYLMDTLVEYPQERTYAIFVDVGLHPIGYACVETGTVKSCPVSFAQVAQVALLVNAVGVILLHNHPSESPAMPSKADIRLARQMATMLDLLDGMMLCDFVIVSRHLTRGMYSMIHDKNLEKNPTRTRMRVAPRTLEK